MDLWIITSLDRELIMRDKMLCTKDEHQGSRVYVYSSEESARAAINRCSWFSTNNAERHMYKLLGIKTRPRTIEERNEYRAFVCNFLEPVLFHVDL